MSLTAMYVEAAARGSGCARRLVDAVAGAAREAGASSLLLHVTEGNLPAERLYRRCGFIPTGRRQPLPHAPQLAEVEMVLLLTAAR